MEQPRSLRPLGLLEIVDQIFRLYRANFWLLFAIAAVVYLPFGLFQGIGPTGTFVALGIAILGMPVAMGVVVRVVSERYLGRRAAMGESYRWMLLRYGSFLLTMLLVYLCFAGVLLIPGVPLFLIFAHVRDLPIWVTVLVTVPLFLVAGAAVLVMLPWIPFSVIAYVVEGQRYGAAIRRATFLLRPWTWALVLLVTIIMAIITQVIQSAIALPLVIPFMVNPGAMTPGAFSPMLLVVGLVNGLTGATTLPLTMGVYVLQYYDARVRKEGYDLQLMVQGLSASLPAPATESSPAAEAAPPAPAEETPVPPPPVPPEKAPDSDAQTLA